MKTVLTQGPAKNETPDGRQATRLRVRRVAMSLSLVIAALYGLIAGNVATVLAGPAEQVAHDQLGFALPAAGIYVLGAVLLYWLATDPPSRPRSSPAFSSRLCGRASHPTSSGGSGSATDFTTGHASMFRAA